MKSLLVLFLFTSTWTKAQHMGFSYELMNEIGTFKLLSLTFSHKQDNTEGITYVIDKQKGDTVYHIDKFLNGYVALSNDGKTIAHLITEKENVALENSIITFYRDGKRYDSAHLNRFFKYNLDERTAKNKLSRNGWLRNDSLLHKMATNPFYITDDKVFLSFDKPLLMVFDMNLMFHIYSGNGANHFSQNYYSIPNAPYRVEFNSEEYVPNGFPKTADGRTIETRISKILKKKKTDKKNANYAVYIALKLLTNGNVIIRDLEVKHINNGELKAEETALLKTLLSETSFSTELLPPDHPAWVFYGSFYLK